MEPAARKTVLRMFSYGLYIVTCQDGERRNAFTANWLTQVSFEPPLVALSVEREAASLPLIRAAGYFGICVLERGQRDIAGRLGRSLRQRPDKLESLDWHNATVPGTVATLPVLANCLGYLICRLSGETPAGDSTLLLAEVVEAAALREGEPLTMREAGYRHSG